MSLTPAKHTEARGRFPQGPTCTLRIHSYALMRDVAAAQPRPIHPEAACKAAPLVVLNNFAGGGEPLSLAGTLFQGLFPSINVQTTHLRSCKVWRVWQANADGCIAPVRCRTHHWGIGQPILVSCIITTLGKCPDMCTPWP